MKTIDTTKTIASLVKEYPDFQKIMVSLGFKEIANPVALKTVGKVMTLEKGAAIKGIDMDVIKKTFKEHGYLLSDPKKEQLKSYIERLNQGEALESVQKDFKENFSHVSSQDIADAEQAILKEGTSLSEVTQLCDVHSALFHDATEMENEKVKPYKDIVGHPLSVLSKENEAIKDVVTQLEQTIDWDMVKELLSISAHYGKKDELLFPLLSEQYNITGPSDVMWAVEDEIYKDLKDCLETKNDLKLKGVLDRILEMIYKEENILFPLCIDNFSQSEWIQIARDLSMFGQCLHVEIDSWDEVKGEEKATEIKNESIVLPGGTLNLVQLRSVLNTLPVEITVIDENDVNVFFNEGEKLFTRPTMALGRKVYSCHPKRVEPMVRMLISDFKKGKRDSMHILSSKQGKQVLVNYYALRDEKGNYLGTLEAVQEIDGLAKALKNRKKGPISL